MLSALKGQDPKPQAWAHMVSTAMAIIADYYRENEEDLDDDDDDDINETNPATLSFQLIDTMSTTLPPLQVNAPLLTQFSEYVKSSDPALVRAGFMSLAYAAEGAPDFFAAQISAILPLVVLVSRTPTFTSSPLLCFVSFTLAASSAMLFPMSMRLSYLLFLTLLTMHPILRLARTHARLLTRFSSAWTARLLLKNT